MMRVFMPAGGAAGVAAAFNTPLAELVFAIPFAPAPGS